MKSEEYGYGGGYPLINFQTLPYITNLSSSRLLFFVLEGVFSLFSYKQRSV